MIKKRKSRAEIGDIIRGKKSRRTFRAGMVDEEGAYSSSLGTKAEYGHFIKHGHYEILWHSR